MTTVAAPPRPGSREWLNWYRLTPTGTPQPELAARLEKRYGLSAGDVARAVVLWDILFRGIHWQGSYKTAEHILHGGLRHHKIPAVPEWQRHWLDPLKSAPTWKNRSWLTPGAVDWAATIDRAPDRYDFASYDVNGMFCSAAGGDLGTGAPELGAVDDEAALKLPGWVLLEDLDPVPAWLGDRWTGEATWTPTPIVKQLTACDVTVLWSSTLLWANHRRWLVPHVTLFREARKRLISIGGLDVAGDPAAVALLKIVKDCYTRAFGGQLRPKAAASNDEDHPAINHGWGLMVPAIAQARMLRAVVSITPARLAGIYHDAAWFIAPQGKNAPLELSDQLGKWKVAGRLPWTDELARLYAGRATKTIARMLKGETDDGSAE